MRIILVLLICAWPCLAQSQHKIANKLSTKLVDNEIIELDLIQSLDVSPRHQNLTNHLNSFSLLTLNQKEISKVLKEKPSVIQFSLSQDEKTYSLLLYRDESFQNYTIKTSDGREIDHYMYDQAFYRGIVNEQTNQIASVSFFENDMKLMFSNEEGNYSISPIQNEEYVLYNDRELKAQNPFECKHELLDQGAIFKPNPTQNTNRNNNTCVPIFMVADYDLYQDQDESIVNVNNFITSLFNEVATVFENESINISISEILIYTSPDPFVNIDDLSEVLYAFADEVQDNYEGSLAHLLSGRYLGGGIAWLNVLCGEYSPYYSFGPYGVTSSLNPNVVPFPTYTWNVGALAHELGHNFGSPHSHACAWGPNQNETLDDCYAPSGSCSPGPSPTNGGTIMSYCHLTANGINFSNGFGLEPGDLIRSNYNNANCSLTCPCPMNDDISIVNISENHSCNDSLAVSIELYNNGANPINSFSYILYLNDVFTLNGTWNGNILPGITSYLDIELSNLPPIDYNVCPLIINPNGNNDPDSSDNILCNNITLEEECDYCPAQGLSTDQEWISFVQIGNYINDSESDNGYGDYTNESIEICTEESINITLIPGFSDQSYNQDWRVWLDLNNDRVFNNEEELIVEPIYSTFYDINSSFIIPNTAVEGETRMRIAMKYDDNSGEINSCGDFDWGEVEDYTINIVNCGCPDLDGDGVCNENDICNGYDDNIDSDNDQTPDGCDLCPNDPNKIQPETCGCGISENDSDGDGTLDCFDQCPNDPNKITIGQCGCGTADVDSDNDGTLDCFDECPFDPNKISEGICGCGISDIDSDGDNVSDCNDECPFDPYKIFEGICGCNVSEIDSDNDGTPNCNDECPSDPNKIVQGICGCWISDIDSDNDGTPDCQDECPFDPNKTSFGDCGCGVTDQDTDNDGTSDCIDNCPNDPNKIEEGICGCGISDQDTDNDGTSDCIDECPLDPNKIEEGICGCGISDVDTDGDFTPDCFDNCPLDPFKTNPGICGCGVQAIDSDDDSTPDCIDDCPLDPFKVDPGICGCGFIEVDSDNDGTPNCNDYCPFDPNKIDQGACGCGVSDVDSDNDQTPDCIDNCPFDPNKTEEGTCGCGISDIDSDNDQTPDCIDNCPFDPNKTEEGTCGCGTSDIDSDNDQTPDCSDNCPFDPNKTEEGTCGCGTSDIDSDNDQTPDCSDNCPFDPNKTEEGTCGCGTSDIDSDNDQTPDCSDNCPFDPNKTEEGTCGCGTSDIDSDNDQTPDCSDNCPLDPNKTEPGFCGCGTSDIDSDNDQTPDCSDNCPLDPNKTEQGFCGCGTPDVDSDQDEVPDCIDACPNDPNKIFPGTCGCGVADVDTDGDMTPNCFDFCPNDPNKIDPGICGCGSPDTDSDFDGILDCFDICPGFDDNADMDHDNIPDQCDLCIGNDIYGDANNDGICDDPNIPCQEDLNLGASNICGIVQAGNSIQCASTVAQDSLALLNAPNLEFGIGFEVQKGASFETRSIGCNN